MADKYIVSARKYRPNSFETVKGQQVITNTLKNAIRSGRIAQAYLFCGPRGVGKTTCARILAKTLNCLQLTSELNPCNVCECCEAFTNNASFNIHELDAASNNSVDDIRLLNEQVRIPPPLGKYGVYIIDEVHMLSTSAFNAFLKTLEEPPRHAVFIMATTEKHKVLPTILSRCQTFTFSRIPISEIIQNLKQVAASENIEFQEAALHIIAQKADGGMRDALSMFDQLAVFGDGEITYTSTINNLNILDYDYYFQATTAILQQQTSSILLLLQKTISQGFDPKLFLDGLAAHFRNLLVCKDIQTECLIETSEDIKKAYLEQSKQVGFEFLFKGLEILNKLENSYRYSNNQRLLVELGLLQLCNLIANWGNIPITNPAVTTPVATTPIHNVSPTSNVPPPPTTVKKLPTTIGISIKPSTTPTEPSSAPEEQKKNIAPPPLKDKFSKFLAFNPLLQDFKQRLNLESY